MASVDNPLEVFFDLVPTGAALYAPVYDAQGELADFRFVRLNPAGQRLLGLPAQPPRTFCEYYPNSVPMGIFAQYCTAYLTGQASTYEVPYVGDGFDTYFRLVAQRSGELLVVNFTDMADLPRSEVEQSLRDSRAREQAARAEAETQRQRFYDVLMQLPASVATNHGPTYVYDLVNPRYQQLFRSRHLQGLPLREALPELQGQGIIEQSDQVYATGEAYYEWEKEAWVDVADTGQPQQRYYNILLQPLRGAHGRVDGLLNFAYDVTEQVAARKQLHQLNQELEARVTERTHQLAEAQATTEHQRQQWEELFRRAPAAISISAGPALVYEFVNPGYQALFPGRELLGKPLLEALPELAGHTLLDILHHVYDTGEPFTESGLLVQLPHPEGAPAEERYFDLTYQARHDETGQINGLVTYANEVTEQVWARREREAQQGELQRIFEQAPVAIAVFRGPGHTIELANDMQLAIWDRTKEEALGKGLFELLPEVVAQGFEQIIDGVMATGQPYVGVDAPASFTRHGVREEIFVSFVHHPLREADGRISGVVAVISNTTEQVRARQQADGLQATLLATAQRQAQQRKEFLQILEQAPVAIMLLRAPNHRIEYVNPAYAQFFVGEVLVGRTLAEAHPAAKELGIIALFDGVYQTGETYVGHELPLELPGDHPPRLRYFDFTYQAYRENDQIAGVTVFATEVTAQVLARRQRENQQQLLQALFEEAPAGIAILTGPDFVFELVNSSYQRFLPARPLLGQAILAAVPELAHGTLPGILQQVYDTGETIVEQSLLVHLPSATDEEPEDQYFTFVYQPRRDEHGAVDGILAFVFEVTEQVRASEQVQVLNQQLATANGTLQATNERLTRTNTDLDTFVYTASHDLKAPITNIEGLLTALRRHLPADALANPLVPRMLTMIGEAVARFQQTLGHLTDVSRLQQAQDQPLEAVDLNALVEAVRLDILPELTAAGAILIVDLDSCPTIQFAAKNLRSIIYNLLSNAIKYRAAERPLLVQLRCRRTAPGHVLLEVQDNGLGLTAPQQNQLFRLFRRLHTHVAGTGVGLYMVKKLIENAGGTITVQSQLGVGSTFTVLLPVAD